MFFKVLYQQVTLPINQQGPEEPLTGARRLLQWLTRVSKAEFNCQPSPVSWTNRFKKSLPTGLTLLPVLAATKCSLEDQTGVTSASRHNSPIGSVVEATLHPCVTMHLATVFRHGKTLLPS